LIKIGTTTEFGKVVAIGWIGERYYWLIKRGVVSMLPASVVEKLLSVSHEQTTNIDVK
jgi:hypothetical protein